MHTWHIHIKGQVQGVGFRPFVFGLANELGLKGWVNNTTDGVHIVFNAKESEALAFKDRVLAEAPSLSRITALSLAEQSPHTFTQFEIVHSAVTTAPKLLLTPDFALCADCRGELLKQKDRRYQYPYTTCTNCGPRFSIVSELPYDRINTSMGSFQMCPSCQQEYSDPLNRRYYSQTNSCSDCGISMGLYDAKQQLIATDTEQILRHIPRHWAEGAIVAIKGIGGYLLTCDATNAAAIVELRKRKHRPSKPFALMYPREKLMADFKCGEAAWTTLNDSISPIVLLEKSRSFGLPEAIAPGLQQVGVMLPYAPLFECLLHEFGQAIVATSGNISQSPIVYQDEKAIKELSAIADLVLVNDREILIPQDDSVLTYSSFFQQEIILRRSRGLAPTYINPKLAFPRESVLAMGAMLKSTFSLGHQHNLYVSQYLGDLEHFDTQQHLRHTINHFLELFQTKPEVVLIDQHPAYPSAQVGQEIAAACRASVHIIQHHHAHFGAVLGENNLIHSKRPILGVIWDGTGLGADKQIWGGEFFVYENYQFRRSSHFDYFDFILGDKMPREPRISALSACWGIEGAEGVLRKKFSEQEWHLYTKLLGKNNLLQTSSLGRIFDAVASMLGVLDVQTYEGEAAMRLEALAMAYFKENGLDFPVSYFQEVQLYNPIPTRLLMEQVLKDLEDGQSRAYIAAKFHYSLADLIKSVAKALGIRQLAFSGGVFQNSILVDLVHHHMSQDFELFFHQELSPNDENISFGQVVCYQIEKHQVEITNNKTKDHVLSDSR